jgi:azurin
MKKSFVILSVSSLLLVACGGNETQKSSAPVEQSAPVQTVEFTINAVGNTMADMAYDTKEIKVKAGASVKVNLVNTGTDETMLHNIVFVKAGTEKDVAMEGMNLKEDHYFNAANPNVIAGSAVTKPGETHTVIFTAPEAGTYSYICTYPGHWQKMRGTMIVE